MGEVAGINTDSQYQNATTVKGQRRGRADEILKNGDEIGGVAAAIDKEYLHLFSKEARLGVVV